MTELFEVELFKESLLNIKNQIDYELKTEPGETKEVKNLFLKSSEKILQAANLLYQAEDLWFKEDLHSIKDRIDYELKTEPGETKEVKNLLLKSSEKILQAANLLYQAEDLMKSELGDFEY